MSKCTGHYIHFRVNGVLTERQYEDIKKLPYSQQLAALTLASSEITTGPSTDLLALIEGRAHVRTN